jgi:hypothetical protein
MMFACMMTTMCVYTLSSYKCLDDLLHIFETENGENEVIFKITSLKNVI